MQRCASPTGVTVSYDSDGNVLSDGLHTYAWDTDGNATTIDGIALAYDAFDRMVEQNRSGSYNQIVYSPTGAKLALMSGTALQKSFIALPGGSTVVYTASGLDHYRHPGWLGSSRFTSSTTRTATGFASYAPFGETVASSTPDLSFTGQNQDTRSGLYDFLYREFDPLPGRWPTPDPAGLAAISLDDPQSLNRYSYVMNAPTSLTDPLGLDPCQGANIFGFSQAANGTGIFTPEDCAANGGTWSSNCYLDGAEIPRGMLMNIASSPGGAVAPCSDSGCPRTGPNGQFQVYAVTHYSDPNCPPTSLCSGIEGHWINLFLGNPLSAGIGASNNAANVYGSTFWLQTKVFFQALKTNWDSVLENDCFARFMTRVGAEYAPTGAPSNEDLIKQTSTAAATAYQVSRGLVVPLRSSVYRGILAGGEKLAGWTAAAEFIHAEVDSIAEEYGEIRGGACQGW